MRLLDLFCGAGGAGMGYSRAGFEVVGVDIKPQKRYPFEFHCNDAFAFLEKHGQEFDVIHASPPCQGYSIMRNLPWLKEKEYPMLIEPTEQLLGQIGKPWIIENVMGAKLPAGWLCGSMFGLPFFRHRFFHSSFYWLQPPHLPHEGIIQKGRMLGARARTVHTSPSGRPQGQTSCFKASAAREAMGVPWMTQEEALQAIPPAYTEWIGKQLLKAIT